MTHVLKLSSLPALLVCICTSLLLTLTGSCSSTSEENSNARQSQATAKNELTADVQVRQALARACFDCHSDQKPGAWNARLAPSYLFGGDKARRALNFSDWAMYRPQQRRAEVAAIGKVVQDGSMPPGDYDFFHPSAKLSIEQKQLLLHWVSQQSSANQP